MLPLTAISELHMHREPYEEVTEYPLASIEQRPTFEGGRTFNDKGLVCSRCTMRYVFSATAWVKHEYDREQKVPILSDASRRISAREQKGVMTTLCDWRNSNVEAILRLRGGKDGDNADQYRNDVFCKSVAGNQKVSINLMCFRCLGEIENEPM
eukprot:1699146-Amphidinium_carterae.3